MVCFQAAHQLQSGIGADPKNRSLIQMLLLLQCNMSGPAGLTPLHLAALLRDHGACTRCLLAADAGMHRAWFSSHTVDGKTPEDFALQATRSHLSAGAMTAPSDMRRQQRARLDAHFQSLPDGQNPSFRLQQHASKRRRVLDEPLDQPCQPPDAAAYGLPASPMQQLQQHLQKDIAHVDGGQDLQLPCASPLQDHQKAFSEGCVPQLTSPAQQHDISWNIVQASPLLDPYVSKKWQHGSIHAVGDASSSEDESLAATHVELACSDSEQSSILNAWES